MLVDRHNSMTAASFEPVSPIVLVAQKILQRAEQKCTEPAFFLICATQRVFFKQMGKKTLDEILRFGRSVTPKSQKRYKGVANTLHRNRKALLLLFPLDQTLERARSESNASIETPLRPPAMFRVSVS